MNTLGRTFLAVALCYGNAAPAVPAPKSAGKHGEGDDTGPGAACKYEPGEKLTWDAYNNQLKNFSFDKLGALNSSLEPEMSLALYDVLKNIKTAKVAYASYTHPGSRKKTFGSDDPLEGANQDEGEGIRVMFRRKVKAKDGSTRTIFVIMFFKPKADGSGFELIEGGDAIRVRAEIGPTRVGDPSPVLYSMAGLSYDVRLKDGKVSSITAPIYAGNDGVFKKGYEHLQGAANPQACNVCHMPNRRTRSDESAFDQKDPLQTGDAGILIKKLNKDFGQEKADKLKKLLENPKRTFVPAGLLEQLEKKCRAK